jgi:circadian clock protein KaiB
MNKPKVNARRQFEGLLARRGRGKYVLRLYIAGASTSSERAITNLRAVLERHLKDRYELTIIDLFQQRERAAEHQIIGAPTLVRQLPLPVRRLIGDMSKTDQVLLALDLDPNSS